jgi:transcription elongation factor GreA
LLAPEDAFDTVYQGFLQSKYARWEYRMTSSIDLNLTDAVSQYLATLNADDLKRCQPEILRFVRWYGGDRPLSGLRGFQVENYAESLGSNVLESDRRMEPLKGFFAYARKHGWTETNLGVNLRVKKSSRSQADARSGQRIEPAIQLTPQGHAAMEAELETLIAQRPKIAEQLRLARADKDFRENAPLDAARDAQAHLEARIREIEAVLHKAIIIDTSGNGGTQATVQLGTTVVVRNLGSDTEASYTLVNPSEAAPNEGKLSAASPVGRALLDCSAGDEVEVQVPAGIMRLRVERIDVN